MQFGSSTLKTLEIVHRFLKSPTWEVLHLLFYDWIECTRNVNPTDCPITWILLVTRPPLVFAWTQLFHIYGFFLLLFWVCVSVLFSFVLSTRTGIAKCQVIPLTKLPTRPLLWSSCLHWGWCCSLIFLTSKQISLFLVAGLSLETYKMLRLISEAYLYIYGSFFRL